MNMGRQKRINEAMRLVDISYRNPSNTIRISKANTFEHELAKFLKCWELLQEDREFYTEVIFKKNEGMDKKGRADIFVPEDFRAFEILHSESQEEFLSKNDYYPLEIDVVSLDSEQIIERLDND